MFYSSVNCAAWQRLLKIHVWNWLHSPHSSCKMAFYLIICPLAPSSIILRELIPSSNRWVTVKAPSYVGHLCEKCWLTTLAFSLHQLPCNLCFRHSSKNVKEETRRAFLLRLWPFIKQCQSFLWSSPVNSEQEISESFSASERFKWEIHSAPSDQRWLDVYFSCGETEPIVVLVYSLKCWDLDQDNKTGTQKSNWQFHGLDS